MKGNSSRFLSYPFLALLVMALLCPASVSAAPLDFTTFTFEPYPQTNGPLAIWLTTPTEARIDDTPAADGGSPNASLNVFYGLDESIVNKRFVGTLTPGTDDDPIGFVLGFTPGDADLFNFPAFLDADYLLIDWKGASQNFNFADTAGTGNFFHDLTPGGNMPVGLALSRVTGLPTADEMWQHADLIDNLDGGVEELARGATLGSTAYPRDGSSVAFDIRYTPTNITVLVDGVQQFNLDGAFPDGHFGLYSLNQGPSAVWSDFEVFEIVDPLSATIDRDTGEVAISNLTGSAVTFRSYSIRSSAGALDPVDWDSIAENFDMGGPNSVDTDPWAVVSSTEFELSEQEEMAGGNGGTIANGQTINLGGAWTQSPFEDVQIEFFSLSGEPILVDLDYVNGPGGGSFVRSDLNADGAINAADWPLFYQNTLSDLSGFSPVGQYIRGDLDGDGDNDVNDFAIFKSDFDLANGAGAFAAMVAGVPEPSSIILMLAGAAAVVALRRRVAVWGALGLFVIALSAGQPTSAHAAPLDFTTFTVDNFPKASGFALAEWETTPQTATLTAATSNAGANVFYGPDNALNTRIAGMLTPVTDDDMVGFVLGYEPGDADFFNPASLNADYLLIDWKGVTQTFNWGDDASSGVVLHGLTGGLTAPVGLALSRVTGLPTADELWGHQNLEENPDGSVEELARGATLGSTSYPRDSTAVAVDIRYTASRVTVAVNGMVEFDEFGTFGDGRFGLYTQGQGPPPIFSDFEMTPLNEVDNVLTAIVHRDTGEIQLRNPSATSIDFDFYQLASRTNSLNPNGWNSLSEQQFQAIGGGEGESWAEAGGSSSSALAELYLQSASSLNSGASVSLGRAYNSQVNGEDLLLTYRLSDGGFGLGVVQYMGMVPTGIPGDYNGGGTVEQADLDLVLLNWGQDGTTPPNGWVNDLPVGIIDQAELDGVLLNWGNAAGGAALGAGSIPEPTSLALIALAICPLLLRRIR